MVVLPDFILVTVPDLSSNKHRELLTLSSHLCKRSYYITAASPEAIADSFEEKKKRTVILLLQPQLLVVFITILSRKVQYQSQLPYGYLFL
jgi:hypothetical protein